MWFYAFLPVESQGEIPNLKTVITNLISTSLMLNWIIYWTMLQCFITPNKKNEFFISPARWYFIVLR